MSCSQTIQNSIQNLLDHATMHECLTLLVLASKLKWTLVPSVLNEILRRDGTMARVLMSIVIVFLCCHSPKIVVNFYEALQVSGQPHYVFFSHNVVVDNLQHFSVGTKEFCNRSLLLLFLFLDGSARAFARAPHLDNDGRQSEPSSTHRQLGCKHCHLFLQGCS